MQASGERSAAVHRRPYGKRNVTKLKRTFERFRRTFERHVSLTRGLHWIDRLYIWRQFFRLFLHVTCIYDYVILCHCTLAAALYFEQSSCDELMEFKQIQTRAQPEESLKHNHSCTTQTCHEDMAIASSLR